MKVVIFAGGTGRRLWPISRQSSPKQFEPIVGEKSTVQLTVDRFRDTIKIENVFISTNERYQDILREQLPEIPEEHFIGEPERRDLAAAVGLAMLHVQKRFGPDETVAIIWGDNYMTNEAAFLDMLEAGGRIISEDKAKIVYMGETPRYANSNLGWIGIGQELGRAAGQPYFAYESWIYRPPLEKCQKMFESGNYVWNTGYFVTTPGFVLDKYKSLQPEMWDDLAKIGEAIDSSEYLSTLHRIYSQLEVISFDDAIVQNIDPDLAVVLHGTTGWSDPGTLYALKESINPDTKANVDKGLVRALETTDSLLYNYEEGKLLAAVGLEGMIVVNTEDALLVVHKDDVALVKELVNSLMGTELEKYS
jgi:mannose-1-phosphate guanylyltransferase